MNVILFDSNRRNYYPLSLTRPISYFRVGILTIKQKWEKYYTKVSVQTDEYLYEKFPINIEKDNLWINSNILPSSELLVELNSLRIGEALVRKGEVFAFRNSVFNFKKLNQIGSNALFNSIEQLSDIFNNNANEIRKDFILLSRGRKSSPMNKNNIIIGDDIFIESGSKISCSILNAENGPIYIGKNTNIMEGSVIRGPFAMLDNSVVKINSKIYEGTTVGPYCKVGGEIINSVFFGYSSKVHSGFMGNSVIGEWCNFGAGTVTSNLKNNYSEVKLWNYQYEKFKNTGLQFCGLIMGDHSKTGINTMFNTGTVVGVGANIFGSGFPRNFIPSFSWGGPSGFSIYRLLDFYKVVIKVFQRKGLLLNEKDKNILEHAYNMTKSYRNEL